MSKNFRIPAVFFEKNISVRIEENFAIILIILFCKIETRLKLL